MSNLTKMSLLRNSSLSLYYRIKELLSINVSGELMKTTDHKTYTVINSNFLETIPPKFYVDGVLTQYGFTIDYNKGEITFDSPVGSYSLVTCDYSYCVAQIFDDYPDIDAPDFKVPAVSIVHDNTEEEPYQLSYGKAINRRYIIDVFAKRAGQRDDLAEAIKELFDEDIPIIDFNLGFPLNSDNTINQDFSKTSQTIGFLELDSINMTPERSIDKGNGEKFIMSIDVDLISYRD